MKLKEIIEQDTLFVLFRQRNNLGKIDQTKKLMFIRKESKQTLGICQWGIKNFSTLEKR